MQNPLTEGQQAALDVLAHALDSTINEIGDTIVQASKREGVNVIMFHIFLAGFMARIHERHCALIDATYVGLSPRDVFDAGADTADHCIEQESNDSFFDRVLAWLTPRQQARVKAAAMTMIRAHQNEPRSAEKSVQHFRPGEFADLPKDQTLALDKLASAFETVVLEAGDIVDGAAQLGEVCSDALGLFAAGFLTTFHRDFYKPERCAKLSEELIFRAGRALALKANDRVTGDEEETSDELLVIRGEFFTTPNKTHPGRIYPAKPEEKEQGYD
jgi:hypothetical protein